MKNFIIALLALLLLPLSPTLSVGCSGVRFPFKWKEPTHNIDGSALTDLVKTTIYYRVSGGIINKKDYKASKPTGGSWKTASILVSMDCKTKPNDVEAWATATTAGGESTEIKPVLIPVPIITKVVAGGGL